MAKPLKDQSETTQALYENYNDYNKSVRTWFVSFGLGGPALFLVHPELVTSLRNAGVLALTIIPFLLGCACQILVALANKYIAYAYYNAKVSKKEMPKFWDNLGEKIWIDKSCDMLTFLGFALAIGVMVRTLVLNTP